MMEYLRARMATPAPLPPAQPAEPRAFTALHFDNEEALVVFIDKQLGKEGVGAAPGDVIMEADVAAASDYLRNHAFAAAVPETGALAEIDFVADWLAVTCPEPANRLRRARRALSSPSGDARPDRFLEGWLAGREAAALIFDGDADETELQISDARHTLRTGLAKSLGDVAAAQRSDADRIRALAPPNPSPTPSDK